MARKKTGTLVSPGAGGIWKGRVTKPDGSRPLYSLGTTDKALAKRKLEKLAAGELPDTIIDESVRQYAVAWVEKREAQGVKKDELALLERHVFDAIGSVLLADVKPTHVRSILDAVVVKGLKRGTVEQVRGVMNRLFGEAWRAEHNRSVRAFQRDPAHDGSCT